MKVTVIGGSGFLGLDISLYLAKKGHRVTVVDLNLPQEISFESKNLAFEKIDMSSDEVEKPLRDSDYIIHAAWDFTDDPMKSFKVNVLGTLNVLEKAIRYNIKHVIFLSSTVVYGRPLNVPIKEIDPLVVEESRAILHAITKLSVEKLLFFYFKERKLPFTIFRIWWAYNDERAPGRSFREILKKIAIGENIVIPKNAGGSPVYNEDLAKAIELSLENKSAIGEVFNIASFNFSWDEVFQFAKNVAGSQSEIVVVDESDFRGPAFFSGTWYLSTEKISNAIGFYPDRERSRSKFFEVVKRMVENMK